jgi:NNP family nitrate/nitrite transporter-like MFS transporter
MGNFGAGITTLVAPTLLKKLTGNGTDLEGWRQLPQIYAATLVFMGIIFLIFAKNKRSQSAKGKSFVQMLSPLKQIRVWRFGLYYYLVFGCFVALSQWLVPYYLNMYSVSLVTAGLLASIFSMPSGLIRALGGWLSDKQGARKVMYWIFIASCVICFMLMVPQMEVESPGEGISAKGKGRVTLVSDSLIIVDAVEYPLVVVPKKNKSDEGFSVFPLKKTWQVPTVKVGDQIAKKQLIAKGTTHIYFQANIWIATFLIFLVGIVWGIGKAAVYKHIPTYFPDDVGAVGGMVGMLGGLGGFFSPIIFGYILRETGLWTSMWIFLFFVSAICLWWMHQTIIQMKNKAEPQTKEKFESTFGH